MTRPRSTRGRRREPEPVDMRFTASEEPLDARALARLFAARIADSGAPEVPAGGRKEPLESSGLAPH